jgi:hypothetical protein
LRKRLRRYCPIPLSISSRISMMEDTSEEKNATPVTIMMIVNI